jgi:hypothetical protein
MAQQLLVGPARGAAAFNTGDGSEHGDQPLVIVTKINANETELYGKVNGAAKYTKNTTSGATVAAAGDLTGALTVTAEYSAVGAANLTTRTAAQMLADAGAIVGQAYNLEIMNTSGGQTTLVGGTGVTIVGTATIAAAAVRWFVVKFLTATTVSIQNVGSGTV